MQTISSEWMDEMLAETAHRCLAEVGGASAPLGADSSAAETTRYGEAELPDKKARGFVEKSRKVYWKYHITAVLGLQIILAAMATPGNVNDVNMLVARGIQSNPITAAPPAAQKISSGPAPNANI